MTYSWIFPVVALAGTVGLFACGSDSGGGNAESEGGGGGMCTFTIVGEAPNGDITARSGQVYHKTSGWETLVSTLGFRQDTKDAAP